MFFGKHNGPAEVGERTPLSGTVRAQVAKARLDIGGSFGEQPLAEMLQYFVDAAPKLSLRNFLHIGGAS